MKSQTPVAIHSNASNDLQLPHFTFLIPYSYLI
jgi:hypothetical protein